MGAQENKQTAMVAYAAFSSGDAAGAMANIDDSIAWTVRGHNALTGMHNGRQAVGELWAKFASKEFRTEPHDFIADGDKVVVLTTVELEGEQIESADVLTYNGDGMLVAFDTLADEAVPNRASRGRAAARRATRTLLGFPADVGRPCKRRPALPSPALPPPKCRRNWWAASG